MYAYADATRLYGLPVHYDWVYIGKARNLRQRLSQHHPLNEANPDLRDWAVKATAQVEIWVALVPATELDEVERTLIREVNPRYNRVRYKG